MKSAESTRDLLRLGPVRCPLSLFLLRPALTVAPTDGEILSGNNLTV